MTRGRDGRREGNVSESVPRPWVYQHSIMEPRRGRPNLTSATGVLGLSDAQRKLLNAMMMEPDRWFTAGDFDGDDPHCYRTLGKLWRRGLVERRNRARLAYEYRVTPTASPAPTEDGARD
jgi:hypothetical protein